MWADVTSRPYNQLKPVYFWNYVHPVCNKCDVDIYRCIYKYTIQIIMDMQITLFPHWPFNFIFYSQLLLLIRCSLSRTGFRNRPNRYTWCPKFGALPFISRDLPLEEARHRSTGGGKGTMTARSETAIIQEAFQRASSFSQLCHSETQKMLYGTNSKLILFFCYYFLVIEQMKHQCWGMGHLEVNSSHRWNFSHEVIGAE